MPTVKPVIPAAIQAPWSSELVLGAMPTWRNGHE